MNVVNAAVSSQSPTAKAMEDAALDPYFRPADRLIDELDLPSAEEVETTLETLCESWAGLVRGTVMGEGEHLEPVLWALANMMQRKAEWYRDRTDREMDRFRELEPAAGSEVVDVQLQELTAKIGMMQGITETFEAACKEGSRQYERLTGSLWRPQRGRARSLSYDRRQTAASMELRDVIRAEKAARDRAGQADPDQVAILIVPGSHYDDHCRIWRALDALLERADGRITLFYAGWNKGCDKIVGLWSRNRAGVTLVNCPLTKSDGKLAGFKRNDRMLEGLRSLPKAQVVGFGSGKPDSCNTMFTDLIKKARKAGLKVRHFNPEKTQK